MWALRYIIECRYACMQKPDVSLRYNSLGTIQLGFFVTVSLTDLGLISKTWLVVQRQNTPVFAFPAPVLQAYATTLGLVCGF